MWGALLKGIGTVGKGLLGLGGGGNANKIASSVANILGATGSGLGAASQASANNRGTQIATQFDLEKLLLDRDKNYQDALVAREEEGRAGRKDAYRQFMSAQHFARPSNRPSLSPYSSGPSRTMLQPDAASMLMEEAMARLQGGNPIPMPERRTPTIDPSLLTPGKMEKVGGWLSPVLSFLGRDRGQPVNGAR